MLTKYRIIVGIAVCLACALAFSSAQADFVRLNDTFDSTAATRYNDANDPLDADWWAVGESFDDPPVISLTTDTGAGGINSGNAMQVNANGIYGLIWANFPVVNLNNVGDWLELTLDMRLPTTTVGMFNFRVGLHSTASGAAPPPSADKIDDRFYLNDLDGYIVSVGTDPNGAPPNNPNKSLLMRREAEDGGIATTILSGTGGDRDNFHVPLGTCELDLTKHEIGLKLVRTDTGAHSAGMRVIYSVDGTELADYIDDGTLGTSGADPFGFLSTFDGVCVEHVVPGYDFLIDNVLIETNVPVPEPSTLALLAAGLIGLLAYAWRKRK